MILNLSLCHPQDRMGEDIRARLAEEEEGADAYGSWLDRWSHCAVLCCVCKSHNVLQPADH